MLLSLKNFKDKSPQELNKMLGDAWLNIYADEKTLWNPLEDIPDDYIDKPHLYITWLMTQPEYFSFICSEILNVHLLPMQCMMLQEMWNRKFPMLIASRGYGKSFLLGIYALLRAILLPGRKVVICGAAFRQSKVIFEYMEGIWNNSPLLRDMVGTSGNQGPKHATDMYRFIIRDSVVNALPLGDGQKIRGQRANDILSDEFASIPRDIFENVVAGFAAVSAHPAENVKIAAKDNLRKLLGLKKKSSDEEYKPDDNQIIISGTAYYDFNHFGEYWKRWKSIIESKGDPNRLAEVFGEDEVPDDFNWKDYSIIRIPFELIPKGFMDEAQVARAKASVHSGIYLMEYSACFSTDSNGFFKRSLIESCVVGPQNEIHFPSGGPVMFEAAIQGDPNKRYVFGVDPASEIDNFSIVVIEINPDHRRIVHVWTTNRQEHKDRVKSKLVEETDFYSYCAKKIRQLMKVFPCERIALDSQGGGYAISEALHDTDKMKEGELPLWPVIDPDKKQDTDGNAGLHILEMVNFASSDWTAEANHGMRKDFEDKVCLFPFFNAASLAVSSGQDELNKRLYDTLEDCVFEIEELKDELSTIIITQTASGRDRWDTPEIKLPGGKKGNLRKDRYSALIMANMAARTMARAPDMTMRVDVGGFANRMKNIPSGKDYNGPAWITDQLQGLYEDY